MCTQELRFLSDSELDRIHSEIAAGDSLDAATLRRAAAKILRLSLMRALSHLLSFSCSLSRARAPLGYPHSYTNGPFQKDTLFPYTYEAV